MSIPLSRCDAANEKVTEFRKAVNTAIKDKSEAEKYSKKVMEKAKELKKRLLHDAGFTRAQYLEIINDINEYKKQVKDSEKQMQSSHSSLLAACSSTMEVLGVSDQVKISDTRFSQRGERKYKCLFCMMRFDTTALRKHHISLYHWDSVEKVSI